MKIFGYDININKQPIESVTNAAPQDKTVPQKAVIRNKITFEQTLTRTRQDLATWRAAVQQAESILNPNRTELYRLYKDVMLDAHLSSLIDTRKNAILSSSFIVTKKGKEKQDKTEYLQKKWFYDFTSIALDSIFYGHSLIQFGSYIDDEFTNLDLVPRQYVKPEFSIVVSSPAQVAGQSYLESPFKEWVIGVGDKSNLGLLAKAAPLVLWKKGALAAWAEYVELFGTPIRIGKTNVRDEETRSNMEAMLREMGSSTYGVFDSDDIIEIIESNRTNAFEVFDMLIERCNSELSKLILGQTSTSDQKAYVGSANVHERVMQQVNEADEIFIENIFTYQLIPFLNQHNLGFNGLKIEVEPDDELNLEQKSKIDIELLKTGLYTIPAEYILETYGTPVVPISTSASTENNITAVKNKLSDYYGENNEL
jgi:hypothetical protein